MFLLFCRFAAVLLNLMILSVYSQEGGDGGPDSYDPNQVRNDDFRYPVKTASLSKAERDKKLDEIVDKFEELRLREEALVVKKETLTKANDKAGLKDLEKDFKDLADDRAEIDREMTTLRN